MAQKVWVFFDDYQYDGEHESPMITICASREIALETLKERWEWYKEHSYWERFVDEDGNFDTSEFDEGWDECDIQEDYVNINFSAKDTWLTLWVEETTIKEE